MEQFYSVFQHLPQNRVIQCRRCGFCHIPDHVKTHSDIPLASRLHIVQVVKDIHDIARRPEDERDRAGPA